jgi:hypothetical protein
VRNFRWVLLALVCLGFTEPGVGWADPAQVDWVENPYAPHVTRGSTARLGTAVGFLYGEPVDALALGITTGFGHRFGRLALESELAYLTLQARGGEGIRLGDGERLGVVARFDVVRVGSQYVGGNSMMAIYVEGGAAVAWNHWYRPGPAQHTRTVPGDTKRVEAQAGFGLMIDHRLQEPIGFPHRIGWFLGWRLAMTPGTTGPDSVCRGTICRVEMPAADERFVLRSMLFQSSLSATF